jgi:NAD(P)-dependent dehydrogenase (short-subunit alcohol dehydrogenase family)
LAADGGDASPSDQPVACPRDLTANQLAESSGIDMSGKVVLVTGGRSGLGFAVSEAMATLGATVVLASRNKTGNEEAVKLLAEKTGATVHWMPLDLESFTNVRAFAAAFIERFAYCCVCLIQS